MIYHFDRLMTTIAETKFRPKIIEEPIQETGGRRFGVDAIADESDTEIIELLDDEQSLSSTNNTCSLFVYGGDIIPLET